MNYPEDMHPDIRVLEPRDLLPAQVALRKQGEGIAGNLVQDRVVVAS